MFHARKIKRPCLTHDLYSLLRNMSPIGIGRRFLLDFNPELLGPLQEFVDPSGRNRKDTANGNHPRCGAFEARDLAQLKEHARQGDEEHRGQRQSTATPCRQTVIGAVLDHVILGNSSLIGHDYFSFSIISRFILMCWIGSRLISLSTIFLTVPLPPSSKYG